MKVFKWIGIVAILSAGSYAGIFGDTDEERAIAQKRLTTKMLHGENPKIMQIRLENNDIKKQLKNKNIDYEIPLQTMRGETNTKEITNGFTITEEEELNIVQKENQTLKKLLYENGINQSKDNKSYSETISAKPKMKIEIIDQAVEEVR